MAPKKKVVSDEILEQIAEEQSLSKTYNPVLATLKENDKKNLFSTNVSTSFIKTGFHLFDYYFGSVVNINNELGEIIRQEPRVGQAAGTFNMVIGNTGTGKAEPLSNFIPTPKGYVTMGDINVGDDVFDIHGKPNKVIGVFPQGVMDVYEVTVNHGLRTRCTLNHLWDVKVNHSERYQTLELSKIIELIDNHIFVELPHLINNLQYDSSFCDDPEQELSSRLIYAERDINLEMLLYFRARGKNDVDRVRLLLRGIGYYGPMTELEHHQYPAVTHDKYLHEDDIIIKIMHDNVHSKHISCIESSRETFITSIKLVGREECQCIKVEASNSLYLTTDCIVTHNTTMMVQMFGNILRQFPYSTAIHFDCEQRFDVTRAETITKLPSHYFDNEGDDGVRYIIRSGAVALDSIQESIIRLYSAKMKNKDKLMIETGAVDEFGNKVKMMQPTLILIDSITSVLSETFSPDNTRDVDDATKLQSNTEGARSAKTIKGFFKDVLPVCKEANIIVYAINHISTNISMNAFIPVSKQHNFLKQDESIPGGKTLLYYPFNIIKLTAKPADNFTEETDGFAGHMVMVEPIKSSSNQSGNLSKGVYFDMVFSYKYGFDPLRTLILYGKEKGIITGTKTRYKFVDDESCAFAMKNIEKEKDTKPIWENIKKYIIPELEKHLSFIEPEFVRFDERSMDY